MASEYALGYRNIAAFPWTRPSLHWLGKTALIRERTVPLSYSWGITNSLRSIFWSQRVISLVSRWFQIYRGIYFTRTYAYSLYPYPVLTPVYETVTPENPYCRPHTSDTTQNSAQPIIPSVLATYPHQGALNWASGNIIICYTILASFLSTYRHVTHVSNHYWRDYEVNLSTLVTGHKTRYLIWQNSGTPIWQNKITQSTLSMSEINQGRAVSKHGKLYWSVGARALQTKYKKGDVRQGVFYDSYMFQTWLSRRGISMYKGIHDSSGCAWHRSVYTRLMSKGAFDEFKIRWIPPADL